MRFQLKSWLSFELYERLVGEVDLSKERTIEMDDFVTDLKKIIIENGMGKEK